MKLKQKLMIRQTQEKFLASAQYSPKLLRFYPRDYALGVMNIITDSKEGRLITIHSAQGTNLCRVERYPKAVLDFGKYYWFNEEEECVQIRVSRLFNASFDSAFSAERVLYNLGLDELESYSENKLQVLLDAMQQGSYRDGEAYPEMKAAVKSVLRMKNIVRYPQYARSSQWEK